MDRNDLSVESRQVAQDMVIRSTQEEIIKSIVVEGVYHTVVEGGFHQMAVSHEAADELSEYIARGGVDLLFKEF